VLLLLLHWLGARRAKKEQGYAGAANLQQQQHARYELLCAHDR
jgi:hypothetical protein